MKRYPQCINKLFYEPLLITPARHASLCKVLEARMASQMPEPPDDDDDDDDFDEFQTLGSDAVIPVHGVLVGHEEDIPASSCGCGLDRVSAMIDLAMADEEVTRLIFDFRTPGGGVTAVPETAAKIAGIRSKQTVAFTDDQCCSGGLWLASQCEYFYTTGSASIGSIGVWCAYLDISRQMENDGENMQAISAGKYKLMGAYWKPLADDEKKMIQADVDRIYGQFKSAVVARRPVADEMMQGQVFDGYQACEIGLCDGIVDGLEDLMGEEEE